MSQNEDNLLLFFREGDDAVETVSVTPAGSDEATEMSALVFRHEPQLVEADHRGKYAVYQAKLLVLSSVHATYGGLVAPTIGDDWSLPIAPGGSPQAGWMAGVAKPARGTWSIPLTLEVEQRKGGGRSLSGT